MTSLTPASIRQRIAELEAIKSAPDVSDTDFAVAVGAIDDLHMEQLRAMLAEEEEAA